MTLTVTPDTGQHKHAPAASILIAARIMATHGRTSPSNALDAFVHETKAGGASAESIHASMCTLVAKQAEDSPVFYKAPAAITNKPQRTKHLPWPLSIPSPTSL